MAELNLSASYCASKPSLQIGLKAINIWLFKLAVLVKFIQTLSKLPLSALNKPLLLSVTRSAFVNLSSKTPANVFAVAKKPWPLAI